MIPETEFRQLEFRQLLVFGVCCCRRLAPCYDAHKKLVLGATDGVLSAAIEWMATEALDDPRPNPVDFKTCLDSVERAEIPVTELSVYREMAAHAWGSVTEVIRFLGDTNVAHIQQVSRWSLAAVEEWAALTCFYAPQGNITAIELHRMAGLDQDLAVLVWNVPYRNSDEWFLRHPMVIAERNKQRYDFEVLKKNPNPSVELVDLLQESSRTQGVQPLLRKLV